MTEIVIMTTFQLESSVKKICNSKFKMLQNYHEFLRKQNGTIRALHQEKIIKPQEE